MKKLLLVMLVPVLVLGIIGCAPGVTETEVDAYIQGAWASIFTSPVANLPAVGAAEEDITLYVSANQITVKNKVGGGLSNPFRVEFAYGGVGENKNRVNVKALAAGSATWAAGTGAAANTDNTLTDLLNAINFGNIAAAGATYITYGALNGLIDSFFEKAVGTALFPGVAASPAEATVSSTALVEAASKFSVLIPGDASEVIIGDLQMYTWEGNIDLGKFKTLMVAGAPAAGTKLHILKFTPPSNDQWWYKYDNILTKPPVGSYNNKGQM